VRRERDDRLAPEGEDIVTIWFDGDALDLAVVPRGNDGQVRKKVVPHFLFVVRGRLDVDERARQLGQIHCHLTFSGGAKDERKEPRGEHSGHCLSIALHPDVTDDSGQALNLSPNPNGFSYRCDFGGQQKNGPFGRAFEADRTSFPGYSWPPHLYQER
jgi:hypothetical protein